MPGSTSYDRIHHRVDLVPFAQGVEGGEAEACFRPQRGHDELLAANFQAIANIRFPHTCNPDKSMVRFSRVEREALIL